MLLDYQHPTQTDSSCSPEIQMDEFSLFAIAIVSILAGSNNLFSILLVKAFKIIYCSARLAETYSEDAIRNRVLSFHFLTSTDGIHTQTLQHMLDLHGCRHSTLYL